MPASPDPPIIAHLRERLAAREEHGDTAPCCTVVGRSVGKTLGVRAQKVDWRPDGTGVYLLTVAQARRALAKWDAANV